MCNVVLLLLIAGATSSNTTTNTTFSEQFTSLAFDGNDDDSETELGLLAFNSGVQCRANATKGRDTAASGRFLSNILSTTQGSAHHRSTDRLALLSTSLS